MTVATAPIREPEIPSDVPCYSPSPTAEDFIYAVAGGPLTEFRFLILRGPRGEGKTTSGLFSLIALGERLVREGKSHLLPIRVAVIRDTWVNLRRTTIASFEKQAQLGLPIEWSDGQREAHLAPYLHFFFFGLETRADVDKLQGFEIGILWAEEVAPGAELTGGISAETVGIGRSSVRQEGVPKRIIVTMNPPDEDHWSLNVEKHLAGAALKDLVVHTFDMKPGERSDHFRYLAKRYARQGDFSTARRWDEAADEFDTYREQNIAFLESIGRHDLVARLGRGEIGGVQMGEAIVSTFSHKLHVTEPGEVLVPMPGSEMFRSWDGGLTPSTVWIEETINGNVNVHGSRTSINKAMAQHILDEVLPFQSRTKIQPRRPERPTAQGFGRGRQTGWEFRDVGDPALLQADDVQNAEMSAGLTIMEMLQTTFEPAPTNDWPPRRDAGNVAFQRKGHGNRMMVRINKSENQLLIQGLGGRAHYPIDQATGRINPSIKAAKRVSGLWLQSLDALLYYLMIRFPAHEWVKINQQQPTPGAPWQDRAQPPRDYLGT